MKKTVLSILAICFTFSAHAANDQKEIAQRVTFEDLKVACTNPARFHNQIAPTNIQVTCKDVQYKWVPDVDGSVSMTTSRLVTASVYADKYAAPPLTATLPSVPQVAACGQFKEVAETVETVRAVTCDELVAFNGTAADFCAGAVNSLRAANAESITVVPTGHTVSLCGTRSQRDQRDQKDMRDQKDYRDQNGR